MSGRGLATTARRLRDRRDQQGSALVETVWLGILLMIPLLWLVISVFEVQRGAFAASGAARAAGRAYMMAKSDAAGEQAARAAVQRAIADQGNSEMVATSSFRCVPAGNCHTPGAVVVVRVETAVRLPFIPRILGTAPATFRIDADHSVPFGQYRPTEAAGE